MTMECCTGNNMSEGPTTSSSSSTSMMIQQEIQTLSLRIDQWCQISPAASNRDGSSINEEAEVCTDNSIHTVHQLMEQQVIPFLKRHFHYDENNIVQSTQDTSNSTPTTTTVRRVNDRTKRDYIECMITKLLRQPSVLNASLSSSSSSTRLPSSPVPEQQLLQQQQQQEQKRRVAHVQLLLRFVLLQWWGPLFVQVYNRMYQSTSNTKRSHTKKKKEKANKKVTTAKNEHRPVFSPLIQDLIQYLQWIALRLLPHEPFVHFLQTECVGVVRTMLPMARTHSTTGSTGCGVNGGTISRSSHPRHTITLPFPIKENKESSSASSDPQWLFLLLQPIWDYFEIKNPFLGEHDTDEDTNHVMTLDRSQIETNIITKRRRRCRDKVSGQPPPPNSSSTSNTTISNTQNNTNAHRKNPLLGDKAKFVGHFFHSTTNRMVSTIQHPYPSTANISSTKTQNKEKDAIHLSQLFRQVPVTTVVRPTAKSTNKSPFTSLNPNQISNTKPATTTAKIVVTPTNASLMRKTVLPSSTYDQENTIPSVPITSHQSSQLPSVMMKPAIMSVMSHTMMTNTITKSNVSASSSTSNLVAEAMEAIQRRKERRRQQQQQT